MRVHPGCELCGPLEFTTKRSKTEDPSDDAGKTEEGWIWNLYKLRHPGMTDEDVEKLEQEGMHNITLLVYMTDKFSR